MRNSVIIVPSYKPDEYLIKTINELLKEGFSDIVVVDDGNGEAYSHLFNEAKKLGAVVLTHAVNLGKGRGMKNAFNYILNEYKDKSGAIVVDADGQHPVEFVKKIDDVMPENPDALILGSRIFSKAKVPLPNLLGNTITRGVFYLLTGMGFLDTQGGLRGYPMNVMAKIIDGAGERYEFESEMLLTTRKKRIPVVEVPMDAVYLGENQVSHFNKIRDSIRIYKVILRFAALPFFAGVLSAALFLLLRAIPFVSELIPAAISVFVGYLIMFLSPKKVKGIFLSLLFTAMFAGIMYALSLIPIIGNRRILPCLAPHDSNFLCILGNK